MADRVVLQFSTTPWHMPDRSGLLALWRMRWENRWSWAIRKFNHSPFSHVDFVLPNGNLLGASDQGKMSHVVAGSPCGVAERLPHYQHWGYRRRMEIATPNADAIYEFAHAQIGKPFDKSGLTRFLSDQFPDWRKWTDPSIWFCAEMGYVAFTNKRYWNPDPPLIKDRVSPSDLLLLFAADPNFINASTFWDPIPGLAMEPWET